MRYRLGSVRRLIGIGLAGTAMVAAASLMPALPASATPVTGPSGYGTPTYLALGDSVAFGYVPLQAVPAPDYSDPSSFVGYPEDVARALHIRVSNASCPGETTASFLVPGAPSNGCENSPDSSPGYRTLYPLHVQYRGTQMQYALKYLAVHRHTRLVTIDIGANDVFLCQETTADACAAELQAVLQEIQANLTTIYTKIRDVAHYHGLLVALTYYSLSYSDPAEVAGTEALNSAIASVTEKFGGKVADGFAAFEGPSAAFGGSPCAAGLLIKLPDGTCNIHPSPAGHLLLAQAIEDVI
jgi:lysophospholipase L1-like esterase